MTADPHGRRQRRVHRGHRRVAVFIDLGGMTIVRQPQTLFATYLPGDDEKVDLLVVIDCTVGRQMKLRIDLHKEGVPYTTPTTTFVESIREGSSS